MNEYTTFVGLDVHKDSIAVAVVTPGQDVRSLGILPYDEARLLAQLRRLAPPENLCCCYEAGPTGFGLARRFASVGIRCDVIAPSLVPRAWGDHVKTDRRDATKLARLLRSGDIQPIHIPDETHEHARTLVRLRYSAIMDLHRHRQQLQKLLLRWDVRPPATIKATWSRAHEDWLRALRFDDAHQQIALQELLVMVDEARSRRDRFDAILAKLVEASPYGELIRSLTGLYGIALLSAATLVFELAPFSRFADAHKCMAAVGVVPTERSSGTSIRRGHITRAGNRFARRILVEAAHHYRHVRHIGDSGRLRNERAKLHPAVAHQTRCVQLRLVKQARTLLRSGKPTPKILVAMARELAGAVWKIGVFVEQRATISPPLAG